MKDIKPHGEMVLIEFVKVDLPKDTYKANKSGVLVKVEENAKDKYQAVVRSVGGEVDLSKVTWKIGDVVVYNEYGCMKFGDEDHAYGLLKKADIWASYTE